MSDMNTLDERDRLLEAALRASGKRPQPSAAGTARAYARAQTEWQRLVLLGSNQQRARWTRWAAGLIAASIASVAIFIGLWSADQVPESAAIVTRVQGFVHGAAFAAVPTALHENDNVIVGYTLETPLNGRLALRLMSGQSLRLDHGTRLTITAANVVRLERGRIYVDSGQGNDRPRLRITTPLASLTDTGTQFQVEWLEEVLRVRVREGSVGVGAAGLTPDSVVVAAGELISLRQDEEILRASSDNSGPAWAWVADISPGLDAWEHRLEPILQWICRELGCRLRYAGALTRELVGGVTLDGSIEGLTPEQALDVIQRITMFRYRLEAGELTVERADEQP